MKRLRLSLDTVFPILRGACPSYGLESSQRSIRLVFENRGSDNACWLGGLAMACLLIFVVGASSLELAYGQSRVYSWEGNCPFFDGNLIADGNWRCLWLGFGNGQVTEGTLMLRPTGSTQPWETHSALVRSEFGLGVEWDFSVDAVTINQLRTHATVGGTIAEPNPWENVWIMAELADDGSAGLYFILKSNGVELGAYRFYGHEQAFLFTSNSPVLSLGVAYTYRLFRQGTMVTVMVNDEVVASASLEPLERHLPASTPRGTGRASGIADASLRALVFPL